MHLSLPITVGGDRPSSNLVNQWKLALQRL